LRHNLAKLQYAPQLDLYSHRLFLNTLGRLAYARRIFFCDDVLQYGSSKLEKMEERAKDCLGFIITEEDYQDILEVWEPDSN